MKHFESTDPVMKKSIVFLPAFFFVSMYAFGQQRIAQQSCKNELISHQADSLKKEYGQDGFMLMKEASITMESEYEMPVIVPLTQGSLYKFVFIGEYTSRLYEVRMYDWQEKQVIFQQKKWGDVDGNIISYLYQPKSSEYHMMKPVQVNKGRKKGLCGYVMMFKQVGKTTGSQSQEHSSSVISK